MKFLERFLPSLLVLAPFLLAPSILTAQTERGAIRGTITDPSGAVVAGAQITAVEVAMGTATSTVSTEAGIYNLPSLRPGIYRVEVEKRGFKRVVREGVVVEVAGVVGLNLALELGDVAQVVTVRAAAPERPKQSHRIPLMSPPTCPTNA